MTLLVAAAVLGVLSGLVFRTGVLAIVTALATTASAQFGAMRLAVMLSGRAETSQLARSIQGVVGAHPMALVPTLAAAGCGAAIAALMLRSAQGRGPDAALIPSDRSPRPGAQARTSSRRGRDRGTARSRRRGRPHPAHSQPVAAWIWDRRLNSRRPIPAVVRIPPLREVSIRRGHSPCFLAYR